ncbi:MAG TPA: hypothetical protein VK043_02740, partial [Burkholderiales bacterium]|nr:hypothetical protein [Burkholderiales bacterium]
LVPGPIVAQAMPDIGDRRAAITPARLECELEAPRRIGVRDAGHGCETDGRRDANPPPRRAAHPRPSP